MRREPPILRGYNYPQETIEHARTSNKLLSIRTELSLLCNYRCIYCNAGEIAGKPPSLELDVVVTAVRQARDLGARSVVVIGGGEPTLYDGFCAVIAEIYLLGMVPVVFTNGSKITRQLAGFLYQHNASIILKMDSMKKEIQDQLAGVPGAFDNSARALKELLDCGFGGLHDGEHRMGISFVSTTVNHDEIIELWKYCRESEIYPNHELLIPRGRGEDNESWLQPNRKMIAHLKRQLLMLDQHYGYDWLPYKPLTAYGCLQIFYSMYLASNGYLRPCADIDIRHFDYRETKSLEEVLKSEFFQYVRGIGKQLEGKCALCPWGKECIGCRGAAFSANIDRLEDPYLAMKCEDPFCWRDQ